MKRTLIGIACVSLFLVFLYFLIAGGPAGKKGQELGMFVSFFGFIVSAVGFVVASPRRYY